MADKNVTIKQWNGSSYDTILPLINYNNLIEENFGKSAIGSYIGTGTCGYDNPTIINIGFKPKLLILYNGEVQYDGESSRFPPCLFFIQNVNPVLTGVQVYWSAQYNFYINGELTVTYTNNGISFYAINPYSFGSLQPVSQWNESRVTYYYFAIS